MAKVWGLLTFMLSLIARIHIMIIVDEPRVFMVIKLSLVIMIGADRATDRWLELWVMLFQLWYALGEVGFLNCDSFSLYLECSKLLPFTLKEDWILFYSFLRICVVSLTFSQSCFSWSSRRKREQCFFSFSYTKVAMTSSRLSNPVLNP